MAINRIGRARIIYADDISFTFMTKAMHKNAWTLPDSVGGLRVIDLFRTRSGRCHD
jgi:hypothetical protein